MSDRMTFGRAWLLTVCLATPSLCAQEWKSGVDWNEPPTVTPGETAGTAPSDAVVLFDGTDLSLWQGGEKWLVEDGVAIPRGGDIQTIESFGDMQLHVEWSAPVEIKGEGQGRGNSGIYIMGRYELQVLDSYDNPTYFDGQAASIYKQTPPMANAMRKPGEWNTYDIIFNAPEFRSNGELLRPAYITVIHNGVVALNHFEILGGTSFISAASYEPHAEREPLRLQFHNDPVRFRNLWLRELQPPTGRRVREPFTLKPHKKPKKNDGEQEEEAGKPDSDKPDGDKPDGDKPDGDKPDSDKPDSDKPDDDKKESGKTESDGDDSVKADGETGQNSVPEDAGQAPTDAATAEGEALFVHSVG